MDKVPIINKKAFCIASDSSTDLAREISSYFRKEGEYFAVCNFPEVSELKKEVNDFEEDGFLSQMLGGHNSIYITNAIVKIRPEFIIFAGLTKEQKSFFNFPDKIVILINSLDDFKKYPNIFNSSPKVELSISEPKDIIIVEDGRNIDTVTAENLAYATNSEIKYVEDTTHYIWHKITNLMYEWKNKNKYASYTKIENLVKTRVGDIDFNKYKTATFFTHGLPYGLVFGNPIPFSYIHKRLRSDIFILNSIISSQESFGTAICFSIDEFLPAEPQEVVKKFSKNNLIPLQLFKDKATGFNFQHYVGFLPYDILHISSHGGAKWKANYVTQKFKDRKGKNHTIEYYEIPSFTNMPLENSDLVAVYLKHIFWKFDGLPWKSKELEAKNFPHYVFEDMRKKMNIKNKAQKDVIREPIKDAIVDSSVLSCNDGVHQGQFHSVASNSSPVIFNNSCWSWSEISTFFLAGGVRSYIGTLWEINNDIATQGSLKFYEDILEKDKSISQSIWEINQNVTSLTPEQKDIFFCWTLPFTKMKKSISADFDNFIDDVVYNLYRYTEKTLFKKEKDVSENSKKVLQFLIWVVNKEFQVSLIDANKEDILEKYGYDLEEHRHLLKRSIPLQELKD